MYLSQLVSSVHGVADAKVVGQDGTRDDPTISINQTGGIDANRSCEGGTMDKQNTLNRSPTVQANVPAPTWTERIMSLSVGSIWLGFWM